MNRFSYLLLLFGFAFSLQAYSEEYTVVLSNTIEFSNNMAQETTFTDQDIMHTLALSGSVLEERKTFQTNASFTLEKEEYYEDTFEGETSLSTGLGLLNFNVIEEFLSWQTSFTRRQTLNDPLLQSTSDNIGYKDSLSTGPTISYILSPTMFLTAQGNYIIVENSQRDTADTKRAELFVDIMDKINSTTSMNVTGQYEVLLDADGSEKFDKVQVGLGLTRRFVDGDLSFSVGRTLLTPELSEESKSNFFSLSFHRERLWLHDVTISYLEDVSDSSAGFDVEDGVAVEGNDIIKRRFGEFSVARVLGVYSYGLGLTWEHEDYSSLNEDEKIKEVSFSLTKDVYSNLALGFDFEFNQTNFLGRKALGKEHVKTYRANTVFQFSQSVTVDSFVQYAQRQSAQNALREYEEFSVGVGVQWKLL